MTNTTNCASLSTLTFERGWKDGLFSKLDNFDFDQANPKIIKAKYIENESRVVSTVNDVKAGEIYISKSTITIPDGVSRYRSLNTYVYCLIKINEIIDDLKTNHYQNGNSCGSSTGNNYDMDFIDFDIVVVQMNRFEQ